MTDGNETVETAIKALRANNFDVCPVENSKAAKEMVLELIPDNAVVGIGDSATLRQIGVIEALDRMNVTVLNPFSRKIITDSSLAALRGIIQRWIFMSNVFLVGTNAVTLDGKLVNTDSLGNRVAAMIFGPKRVIIVIGKNKIVKNLDAAFHRIKQLIAPYHAKTKQIPTPCSVTGVCINCDSPRRICNITTILEKKPRGTDTKIILVDEDLGLGWDESWPKERVQKIKSNYASFTWTSSRASSKA